MAKQLKKKVVILGGGMAALSTAFELTNRDDCQTQFAEISVYQLGWRLGGKAAGARNQQVASRVEDLGPHVWFGFYDHTFRMMRRCYQELNSELTDWFEPQNAITFAEFQDDQSVPWTLEASGTDTTPGDDAPRLSPWQLIASCTELVQRWWRESADQQQLSESQRQKQIAAEQWIDHAAKFTFYLPDAVSMTGEVEILTKSSREVLEQAHLTLREYFSSLAEVSVAKRRLFVLQDLALSAMSGALRDDVPRQGFHALDKWDFRDWLKRHGAMDSTIGSALVTGLYDLAFAYEGGDRQKPLLAAGVALRLLSRATFESKGALMWTPPAGMGDAVFARLYEVLRDRGVKFHFFHRVTALRLGADGTHVAAIDLERQATAQGDYDPLVEVDGRRCWPRTPRYDQLVEGNELEQRGIDLESPWTNWEPVGQLQLHSGQDFDEVVLGIPLGALADCCDDLFRADKRWRDMLEYGRTVPTAVAKMWFNRTRDELGWTAESPFLTGFLPLLDTCDDASATIAFEGWDQPRYAATLRGVLGDDEPSPELDESNYGQWHQQRVSRAAMDWLSTHSTLLWPQLHDSSQQVRWEYLVDLEDRTGPERFLAQHLRANVSPSDRYVQSPPRRSRFRLSPSQAWFGNLFVCGDWTYTVLNVGCMEAAVMSGLQAAAGLRGEPPPQDLVSDWCDMSRAFSDHRERIELRRLTV